MKSKKVLIVDDNDLNRKLFENLIGQYYSYKSAINGLDAIDLLTKEPFDLILMDIQMPKMDGISALKKIQHSELSESPIIAVTAFAEESDRSSFLKMGFSNFITKPIRPKEFLEVIGSHLSPANVPLSSSESKEIKPLLLDLTVVSQLMKYNSKETIIGVFTDFLFEATNLLSNVEKALSEKNQQELVENLHILKGNSGTLGANSIYLMAKTLESFGRDSNWEKVEEYLEKLKNEKSTFEKYLAEELTFEL